MPTAGLPRPARSAALLLACALLPGWIAAGALAGGAPREPEAAPLAAAPACEGRLRVETLAGEGAPAAPRRRLHNPGGEAVAWRLAGGGRLQVLRGGQGAWLPAEAPVEAVICR